MQNAKLVTFAFCVKNDNPFLEVQNMRENIIEEKSFAFAIRIVRLSKHLRETKKEYILSKQLLRCGTSIGANIAEAQRGQSKADFIAKMSIALKEANET